MILKPGLSDPHDGLIDHSAVHWAAVSTHRVEARRKLPAKRPNRRRRDHLAPFVKIARETKAAASIPGQTKGEQDEELPDGARVAVCFVGQFLRHGQLTGPGIQDRFGDDVKYDAFLASSDQHTEEAMTGDKVTEGSVCENLLNHGFSNCTTDIQPYNGSVFIELTKNMAPFQMSNGLYPYRIASFFSTIQRCARLVERADEALRAEARNGGGYAAVMVTRIDVVSELLVVRTLRRQSHRLNGRRWWKRIGGGQFDMVAKRYDKKPPRIEDRVFFGSRQAMLPLVTLYDNFDGSWHALATHQTPELLLWEHLTTHRNLRVGVVSNFVAIKSFQTENRKYSISFRDGIIQSLGLNHSSFELKTKCNDFDDGYVYKMCVEQEKKVPIGTKRKP